MVFSEYAKISLDMLRIPQGLIFCIFGKNYGNYIASNTNNCAVNILKNIVSG